MSRPFHTEHSFPSGTLRGGRFFGSRQPGRGHLAVGFLTIAAPLSMRHLSVFVPPDVADADLYDFVLGKALADAKAEAGALKADLHEQEDVEHLAVAPKKPKAPVAAAEPPKKEK